MTRLFTTILKVVTLYCAFQGATAYAQPPPADFRLTATAGGVAPWTEKETLTIDSSGQATYTRYKTGQTHPILAESTFTVSLSDLQQLWQTIQDSSFFTLNSSYADSSVMDGSFAQIRIKANGQSHQVFVRNAAQPRIQAILSSLNAITPGSIQLRYTPPQKYNLVPRDPCGPGSGLLGLESSGVPYTTNPKEAKALSRPPANTITALPELIHPGTAVGYGLPLQSAVGSGIAGLKSKGGFFGDAVSLTVDNTHQPPGKTIDINLYLEFYGPNATVDNVLKIMSDILQKWNGHTTSDGTPVNMKVIPKLSPTAVDPPGTPGYHQIALVPKGTARSHCDAIVPVNTGTGSGLWELDGDPGLYAHEAGHLMGLPDRYDDYHKQPDGSWSSSTAGKSFANDDDFAKYIMDKDPPPGGDLNDVVGSLKLMDVYGIAKDGFLNDVMNDGSKSVSQADIDFITAHPGLLISYHAGDVLVNKNHKHQNLVITHTDEMFVKPGEKRTLNGIYTACIDASNSAPQSVDILDIIPSLDTWGGITAAGYLSKLTRYIDSSGLYCGSHFTAQGAVWSITDNYLLGSSNDAMLNLAGLSLSDQALYFPRLTSKAQGDTTSHLVVPDELFPANIQPRFIDGTIGSKTAFRASVSRPAVDGFSTAFSWVATGPNGSSMSVITNGDSAFVTPDRRGISTVGLHITVNDSSQGPRQFDALQKAYVIVPDNFTETFEHGNLTDKFPWKTYGNAPWRISNTSAQTGSFSAVPGDLSAFLQTSTLEIRLSLPRDSVIAFSVRTATAQHLDFLIDSAGVASFWGLSDWGISEFPIKAGQHVLTWTILQNDVGQPKVWLDNVFFPPSSIVTSADKPEDVPAAFGLFQNYPNPFNPSTTIRYGLANRSRVTLTVYNTLGQQVAVLQNGEQEAGYHDVQFDAKALSSGVYFYRIQVRPPDSAVGRDSKSGAGNFVATKRLLLLK